MTLHSELEKLERERAADADLPPLPPGFVYEDARQAYWDALRADMAASAWESPARRGRYGG